MTRPLTEKATPDPEAIKASYGFVAMLANRVPEIQSLLQQAVKENWTTDRFVMRTVETNWWKTTPEGGRNWLIRSITDPATAEMELQQGVREVYDSAALMGFATPDIARARELWVEAKTRGLDQNAARAHYSRALSGGLTTQTAAGRFGEYVNQMYKQAFEYGYSSPNLDQEILGMARYLIDSGGTAGIDGWTSKMIDYAASFYAPYKEDIRGGKTVADVAKPVIDRVAQLLEVSPEALSMNDPIVRKAMTEWGKENRPYSLREVEDMARADVRYDTTDQAIDAATKMMQRIGQNFGFVPGGGQ